jgi:intracellular septation protein A
MEEAPIKIAVTPKLTIVSDELNCYNPTIMNNQMLKQLSYAFLPILIFIIADELYGVTTGMVVAMCFSITEFIYTWIKHKNIDYFILFDAILISILGGISIISHNEIFFKLKPALIQTILLAIFGIAAFTNYPLMENMTRRYVKDLKLSEFQRKKMKSMSKQIFFIFLIHTAIIIYTAFYSSDRVWAFASGGLFYIIMGIFMAIQWWQSRKMLNSGPRIDIFDENENKIGEIPEIMLQHNPNLLHRSIHLHIVNKNGELFFKIGDGIYEPPIISHVYTKETVSDAIIREIEKRLKCKDAKPKLLFEYLCPEDNNPEFIPTAY